MKKFLAIISSYRSKGNGESIITLCEKFLPEYTNDSMFEKVFLNDYKIENCKGCMRCAINKEFCKINDDLKKLIDKVLECDYLLISSPVYFLGTPSIIKTINDRLLFLHNLLNYSERKHAGLIITAGRPGWEGLAVQNLSTLALSLGFNINDLLFEYGQGPSEVLLNINLENNINIFLNNLINPEPYKNEHTDRCPVCFGKSFEILDEDVIKCPTCNIKGEISKKDNKTLILFSESDINNSRWTEKNLVDHMEHWVEESGLRYREKVKEILKKKKSFASLTKIQVMTKGNKRGNSHD